MVTAILQTARRYNAWLILGGLACLLRAAIGLYEPDYWSPVTRLDYAAVGATSLAFLLLAIGIWVLYRQNPGQSNRFITGWLIGVMITCVAAASIGLSNFLEDAMRASELGIVWVIGILALVAGLLTAAISAFWTKGLGKAVGALLLACAASILFIASWGWFSLGLALLALAMMNPSYESEPVRWAGE